MSAAEDATKAMENLTVAPPAPKGTAKRDALRANEIAVQKKWEECGAFEANPLEGEESFMVTFPYPYSNGHLHIGHAFSLTKAIFRAQFERHQGKNVLFPFAFHCTGMPIQAVSSSNKRKQKQIEVVKRSLAVECHLIISVCLLLLKFGFRLRTSSRWK
jgi:isoleucyl-tRNA synthetase